MPSEPRCRSVFADSRWLYLVVCPWCGSETESCVAWIAAWAELVTHYGRAHRDVQDALTAWLRTLPGR